MVIPQRVSVADTVKCLKLVNEDKLKDNFNFIKKQYMP